jgi:dipeptidyl aminopeptidase/acylaminoacyl peptidase
MKKINNTFLLFITAFIFITLMISVGGCATMQTKEIKDEISNLSFSHDGKKVLFDRCRDEGCQKQVYDLETGELAAYQSPANERWTMARQSYDGKKIVFSVIPIVGNNLDLTQMQIGIMDTDGKNYKKLTSDPMPKIYPTFSHSGKKILYVKAGRIRKQGRTPASDYDAWEMDIATGKETRLTYFKYFHMAGVSYFPGDEKILYEALGPFAFPGLNLPEDSSKALNMIAEEAAKRKIYLVGLLTIKKGDLFPERPYYLFEEGHPPEHPLLSNDGKLFFTPAAKSGKFYLYSPDGNHKRVGGGGDINSAAISPDGGLLALISVSSTISITTIQNVKADQILYLPSIPKTDKSWEKARQKKKACLNSE